MSCLLSDMLYNKLTISWCPFAIAIITAIELLLHSRFDSFRSPKALAKSGPQQVRPVNVQPRQVGELREHIFSMLIMK